MDASPIHVAIAGSMMFQRVMGKASFCNIQDLQGKIQVYVARDASGADSYADFKKSDNGDIFGLEGFAFRTRTGEISQDIWWNQIKNMEKAEVMWLFMTL